MSAALPRRRVLVTGGASGLGLAIATAFADAGAAVWIADADADRLHGALASHPGLRGERCDVAVPEDVDRTCRSAGAALGVIDVLVNNAGIGGPAAPVEDVTLEDWNRTLAVNVSAMYLFARALIPAMKARRDGCILNVSTASVRTALPDRTPYVVSKYAVHGLTANLARELGPFGIRCNALLPGLLDNPRGRALVERRAREAGVSTETAEQEMLRFISLRTWVDPAEVAATAVFLASAPARHITGQFIGVCGGVEWE